MMCAPTQGRAATRFVPAARIGGLCLLLLAAGCAGVKPHPPEAGPARGGAAAVEPAVTSRSTGGSVAPPASPDTTAPAKTRASAVPAEQARKKNGVTPGPAKPPPLDLAALEKRLRETDAIGVFTKIALKNQVDDLLGQFRAFYQGRLKTTLGELRQPYDMLLLKVLSLLQDSDPELASTIVASREAIWSILADPAKFTTL